jgi:hypothetical protein
MKKLCITLLSLTFSMFSYGESNQVSFNQAGFSINALDSPPSQAGSQPLTMMLAVTNGFSANVNVQIQPYQGTLEEYKTLTDSQFVQMGLKTISSTIKGNSFHVEYSGNMQGNELHFYAKAIKKGSSFYLATATDRESQWHINAAKLKSVVDSFVLQ